MNVLRSPSYPTVTFTPDCPRAATTSSTIQGDESNDLPVNAEFSQGFSNLANSSRINVLLHNSSGSSLSSLTQKSLYGEQLGFAWRYRY